MMKVYEVEYRAVITLAAEDMQKATLYGAAVIKDNGKVSARVVAKFRASGMCEIDRSAAIPLAFAIEEQAING